MKDQKMLIALAAFRLHKVLMAQGQRKLGLRTCRKLYNVHVRVAPRELFLSVLKELCKSGHITKKGIWITVIPKKYELDK